MGEKKRTHELGKVSTELLAGGSFSNVVKFFCTYSAALLIFLSAPPADAENLSLSRQCDQLAGDPFVHRWSDHGVSLEDISPQKAYTACSKAVAENPSEPRNFYNFGRVLFRKGNISEAVKNYLRAIHLGYKSTRMFVSGFYHSKDGGIPRSNDVAQILREHALNGDAIAQFELARFNESEIGSDEDLKTALKWYFVAAEKNHPEAIYNLAVLFREGQHVEQDKEKYLTLLHKSAELGNPYAQYDIGRTYLIGEFQKKDKASAVKWLTISAKKYDFSQLLLGCVLIHCFEPTGTASPKPENYQKGLSWLEKSGESGNGYADFYLALVGGFDFGKEQGILQVRALTDKALKKGVNPLSVYYFRPDQETARNIELNMYNIWKSRRLNLR